MRSLNASDYNINLSFIEQYREGKFVVKNLYAPEAHKPFLIRPIYFLLSVPFSGINISNPAACHFIRILTGGILMLFVFYWISLYISEPKAVLLTFLLLAFTSGVGFFIKSWVQHPLDLTVPESNLFLTLGEPPHFISSLFLLLFGLTNLYVAIKRWPRALFLYLLSLLLLWFEHPYEAVVLATVGFFNLWLLPSMRLKLMALAGLMIVSAPAFLYYSHLRRLPVFASWAQQNVLKTPSILLLILGFLPFIIFAVQGFRILWRNPEDRILLKFLTTWIVVQIILCYIPVPFQRRFIAGLQFPLAILAGVGLAQIRNWPITASILFFSTFSNAFVMWHQIQDLKPGKMPFYLPASYIEAFDWLKTQPKQGIVLSGYVTGNFIPGYTGLTVFAGHSIQTPDVGKKKREIIDFYGHPNESFLRTKRIRYIFYGFEERGISPKGVERTPVFKNGDVLIY